MCLNVHMENLGSGRHRKLENTFINFKNAEFITNLNEFADHRRCEWKFGSMRLVTSLKRDTRLHVVMQKILNVGNSKCECWCADFHARSEEKWFQSVLFHRGGNTAMEASSTNRVIRWDPTPGRAESESDTRHVAMVLRDLGLEKSTPVVTPVPKRSKSEELVLLAGAKPLNAEDTTLYRSVTMRVNYSSLDRPDLSFAAGPLARGMKSRTTKKDLGELKRAGRYLRGRPVGATVFEPQALLGVLKVFCDADHAGDLGTRKSSSGMAVVGVTIDQAWEHGAKHHDTGQLRVRMRVAQVVSSCGWNQSNAE